MVSKSVLNYDIPPSMIFGITQVEQGVWWCSVDLIVFRLFYHITLAIANMFGTNLYCMFLIYDLVQSSESRRTNSILTFQTLLNVTK